MASLTRATEMQCLANSQSLLYLLAICIVTAVSSL
jgi:hypothetical protein